MKLPVMSARKVVKILKEHGFKEAGQRGSPYEIQEKLWRKDENRVCAELSWFSALQ